MIRDTAGLLTIVACLGLYLFLDFFSGVGWSVIILTINSNSSSGW